MDHYKAIKLIQERISSLQKEKSRLNAIDTESRFFAGNAFIDTEIHNIDNDINSLTNTIKILIKIN